jgi:hypothetical protein
MQDWRAAQASRSRQRRCRRPSAACGLISHEFLWGENPLKRLLSLKQLDTFLLSA